MTGNTGYKVSGIELHMDNDVFLSVGELKKLRREVIAQLDNNILSSYCRTYKEPDDSIINPCCMTYNEQDNSILSSDCDAHNEHNNNCTGIEVNIMMCQIMLARCYVQYIVIPLILSAR